MRVLESLFPRFVCPKCGWQMSEAGDDTDLLPVTASFVALALAGAVMPTAWQFVLGLLWLAAVLIGHRLVIYRCPVCGREHSDRDLAEDGGGSSTGESPCSPGAGEPSEHLATR